MKQIMKEYMFDRIKNQQGAILLPVVIALTSLLGAAVYYDVPGAVDEYAAALTRMRDGEPTEADVNAFPDAFSALANAAGALPIPSDATDVLAIALSLSIGYSVDIGIADTPAPSPAGTSLSNGCSMTLSSTSVKPGDTITATLTTPTLLHSKIGNISCEAGVVGFGISIPAGTSPVGIPSDIKTDNLTVKCYVIAAEGGDTICSPAVNVKVVHEATNIMLHSDVTFHGNLFLGAREQAPLESLVDGVFVPNRHTWDLGTTSWADPSAYITFDLGGVFDIISFVAQVDDNEAYILSYWDIDSNSWQLAWDIPNYDSIGHGMTTRPNPEDNTETYSIGLSIRTNALKLQSGTGAGYYSVSEVQAFGVEVSGE